MMMGRLTSGNWELTVSVATDGPLSGSDVRIWFSSDADRRNCAFLNVGSGRTYLGRRRKGSEEILRTYEDAGHPPWRIRLQKRGAFFRFWINDGPHGYIKGPTGQWDMLFEPTEAHLFIDCDEEQYRIDECRLTSLTWFEETTLVIPTGEEGSWTAGHVLPGGIIEYEGRYYLYVMGSRPGEQEGGLQRVIGVAMSDDLERWELHPEPVVTSSNVPYDNLYPNGAIVTGDGRVALLYSSQMFPKWNGFCLTMAEHPLGPFVDHPGNPVFDHGDAAHEFDVVALEGGRYRYLLMYAGFTPNPPRGPAGDRGYALYSNDLIHWVPDPDNPVFGPDTLDDWDAIHVRTRSLTKIGDTWYLWYEGCNTWKPHGKQHHGWWDTVGLARSKDLRNWEYHPRNPALESGRSHWIGWPRMVIRNGAGFVFMIENSRIVSRKIPIEQLADWQSDLGDTIDLLQEERA